MNKKHKKTVLERPALNCCTSISWSKINNSISKKERGMLSVIIKKQKSFLGPELKFISSSWDNLQKQLLYIVSIHSMLAAQTREKKKFKI